jgi:hypothetical protein
MLWDVYKLSEFKPNNTIIIDDYSEVYKTNPKNCKQIYEFNYFDENSEKDNHLLNIIPLLKSLASNNNIGNTMICDYKDYKTSIPNNSKDNKNSDLDSESSYSTIESDSDYSESESESDSSIDTESLLSIDIKPVKKLNKKKIVNSDSDSDYSDSKSSRYSSDSDNDSLASKSSN